MPFLKKKPQDQSSKRYHSSPEVEDRKRRAAKRNKEAQERLERALERLRPVKDISDFLGDA